MTVRAAPDRTDVPALVAAVALIVVAAVVGRVLLAEGRNLVLPSPPLIAYWGPHVGWGTLLVPLCIVVGLRLQRVADRLPRRRLLLAGWLVNLAWLVSLTLIDGLHRGWTSVLTDANEYLHDLPRIASPAAFLRTFSHYIAFSPTVDGTQVWTTHVAGHPPLVTLLFWALDRIGLGGGFWAGTLCIVASSLVVVALPVTLHSLGAEVAAVRVVPFLALFPGAVWMAVSADGLFAGLAASGLALVCVGAARGRARWSLLGGLLLGAVLFCSYGLVLFGVVVATALVVTARQHGVRAVLGCWLAAGAGVLGVFAVFLALGFDWFTGLAQLKIRYYQGIASDRPFSYFVYANLAAWLVSCSPLLAVGVVRAVRVLVRPRPRETSTPREGGARTVAALAVSGVAAAMLADLSALSKAETERIWLAFGTVTSIGLSLVRGRRAAWYLLVAAVWAVLVNSLFRTGW